MGLQFYYVRMTSPTGRRRPPRDGMGGMGTADALIFLIAALVDLAVFFLLRGASRRAQVNQRVVRSLETALRYQRVQ